MLFGDAMKFSQRDGIRVRRTAWPESWQYAFYDGTRVRMRYGGATTRTLDTYYPTQRDMTMDDWEFVRACDRAEVIAVADSQRIRDDR